MVIDTDTLAPGARRGHRRAVRPGDPPGRGALRVAGAPGAAAPADPRHGRHPYRPGRAAVRPRRRVRGVGRAPRCSATRPRRCGCSPSSRRPSTSAVRLAGRRRRLRAPRRVPARGRRTPDEAAVSFGARLDAALDERGSLCVGIDPHAALLEAWGLPDDADGLARFADICVAAFADTAAVVKPQSAFFEVYGSAGIAVLERTVAACRAAGALVAARRQARRHRLDDGRLRAGLPRPGRAARRRRDHGQPVPRRRVAAAGRSTSCARARRRRVRPRRHVQPGGAAGAARAHRGRPDASPRRRRRAGRAQRAARPPLGSLGVVVGATIGDRGRRPRRAQRADPRARASARRAARPTTCGGSSAPRLRDVLPSVSREVLRHGPDVPALRAAAARLADEFAFLRAGRPDRKLTKSCVECRESGDRGRYGAPRAVALTTTYRSLDSPQGKASSVTNTLALARCRKSGPRHPRQRLRGREARRPRRRQPAHRDHHGRRLLPAPARGQDGARQQRPQLRLPAVRHRVLAQPGAAGHERVLHPLVEPARPDPERDRHPRPHRGVPRLARLARPAGRRDPRRGRPRLRRRRAPRSSRRPPTCRSTTACRRRPSATCCRTSTRTGTW